MQSIAYQRPTLRIARCLAGLLLLLPAFSLAADNDEQITFGRQQILIDYPSSFTETERDTTHRWLHTVAAALLSVYGKLPEDKFHITIKRASGHGGPVPWGQVNRHTSSGVTDVLLVIHPEQGVDALLSDWTAFHELSHLLIPYRGYGNLWLSEGLASYYQNIIQARSGRFDAKEMWRRIMAGFERGRQQQRYQQLSLTQVSDRMLETRQFMRIHWSGVLYWLTADVTLRREHHTSLDQALMQLRACCMQDELSAQEIVEKLDALTGTRVFTPLFYRFAESKNMPDYLPLLAKLGVLNNTSGDITFEDKMSLADIRKAMENGVHPQ